MGLMLAGNSPLHGGISWPIKPDPTLFQQQRLDVVEHALRVEEVRAVDLADVAPAIDQEHLEHVGQLSSRAGDLLTESFHKRVQLFCRSRREEVPAKPGVALHHAAPRIAAPFTRRSRSRAAPSSRASCGARGRASPW